MFRRDPEHVQKFHEMNAVPDITEDRFQRAIPRLIT